MSNPPNVEKDIANRVPTKVSGTKREAERYLRHSQEKAIPIMFMERHPRLYLIAKINGTRGAGLFSMKANTNVLYLGEKMTYSAIT